MCQCVSVCVCECVCLCAWLCEPCSELHTQLSNHHAMTLSHTTVTHNCLIAVSFAFGHKYTLIINILFEYLLGGPFNIRGSGLYVYTNLMAYKYIIMLV